MLKKTSTCVVEDIIIRAKDDFEASKNVSVISSLLKNQGSLIIYFCVSYIEKWLILKKRLVYLC